MASAVTAAASSGASSIIRNGISRAPVWMTLASTAAAQSTRFPSLTGDQGHYDVVVVGGGIVGVTSALLLKEAGRRVALVEARQIGSGTTGSSTAKLTSQQNLIYSSLTKMHGAETAKLYGEMQEAAIAEAERIVNELELKCEWRRMPHYTWTCEEKKIQDIQKEAEYSQSYGLPAEYIQGSPDDLPASIGAKAAVLFKNQVAFNPYDFCKEVASHIQGDGCSVFEGSRVLNVSEDEIHSIEVSGGGKVQSDHVILATHLPILDRSGHFAFLPPSRTHCIAVRLSQAIPLKMCISADEPMRSLRIVDDGHVLVVAGESMEIGDETDTYKRYEALEKWSREHFPVDKIEARWSAMDYISSDHLSWTGYLYRGSETIYTATGFSKWGLTQGIASSLIIRDLILSKETIYSTTWFKLLDARRLNLLKSGLSLLQENIHTAKHFIGDKIAALTVPNISTLKAGQGGLVKAREGTVGAYLDEAGHYHLVKPVCTHLGCHLLFNQGDKVWDCPCHGSQFTIDGEVIHGPACNNLQTYKDIDW